MAASNYDVVITGGRYFDGTGGPSAIRHIGIKDGRIAAVSETALQFEGNPRIIDATGHWVTPGFLDTHTHYDAELELAAGGSLRARYLVGCDGGIVFEYDEGFRRGGHDISPFHLPRTLRGPVRFDELRLVTASGRRIGKR